jgi:hypothetical protein
MQSEAKTTQAPDDPMRCKHCGVLLPASCPAAEGYGCPSWEDFKEQEAEHGRPT